MSVFVPFITGVIVFHIYIFFPLATTALVSFLLAINFRDITVKTALIVLLGLFYALLRTSPEPYFTMEPTEFCVSGVFSSIPDKNPSYGYYQDFLIKNISSLKKDEKQCNFNKNPPLNKTLPFNINVPVRLFVGKPFQVGEGGKLLVKLKSKPPRINPGAKRMTTKVTGYIKYAYSTEKPDFFEYPFERIREQISKALDDNLDKTTAGFLKAITIGSRKSLDISTKESFQKTGLFHLLSISGTHFAIMQLVLYFLTMQFIVYCFPHKSMEHLSIFISPKQIAAILSFPFLLFYLMISGLNYPTVRAFIFVTIAFIVLFLQKNNNWRNTFTMAAFIILLIKPSSITSLSFQLTFTCVLIISLVVERFLEKGRNEKTSWLNFFFGTIKKYLYNTLLISTSVNLGLSILVSYYFHSFSLISPVANIIIVPLTCCILLPVSLLCEIVFLTTGVFPFESLLNSMCALIINLVKALSEVPLSSLDMRAFPIIFVVLFYFFLFLYLLEYMFFGRTYNKWKYLGLIGVCLTLLFLPVFFITTKNDNLIVTFLSVGQGDSAVIETPDNKAIVIDTGLFGIEVESFLKHRGIRHIEYILISHFAKDHSGGLKRLLQVFKVKQVLVNSECTPEDLKPYLVNKVRTVKRGDRIEMAHLFIDILNPDKNVKNSKSRKNNNSLVVKIRGKNSSFLFTGDIEKGAEKKLLALNLPLKAQVLKVAHHGSKTSSYGRLIKKIAPEYSIVSAGLWNHFGHPHKKVLKNLSGSKQFITYKDGAISFIQKDRGLTYKTYKDQGLKSYAFELGTEINNMKVLFAH